MIVWNRSEKISVHGAIIFETLADVLMQWQQIKEEPAMLEVNALVVDCASLERADSSFIAFLVELWRWTHELHKGFVLRNIPTFLKHFLTVYGVESFLLSDQESLDARTSDHQWPIEADFVSLKK